MRSCSSTSFPVLALLAASLWPVPVLGQGIDKQRVEGLLEDAVKEWKVPGAAVVIVREDRLLFFQYGVRELGRPEKVTPDTVFGLSSCSKAFLTLAMAMLVDEGKIAWDDPVRKHLPGFRLADPLADANVTLRDLLCHRTGLSSHEFLWYHSPLSPEEQVRRIGLVKPSRSFRSTFQYQNIMVCAAGLAVSAAAGIPWDEFVRKRILEPLEMTGVSATTAAALEAPDHATPHRKNKAGKIEVIPWHPFAVPNAALSVNANARDLGKWLQFQLGDGTFRGRKLVSTENLAETHMPQTIIRLTGLAGAANPFTSQMSYGLGWVVHDYRGHALLAHGGRLDGMRTHVVLVPSEKLGLAILSNLDDTQMNYALGNTLLDQLLGLEYLDWNDYFRKLVKTGEESSKKALEKRQQERRAGTKPSRKLEAYSGVYEDPAYGTARVLVNDGKLVWQWNKFECPLEHWHLDTFQLSNDTLGDPQLTFSLGGDGEVASLRVLEVEFRKKKAKN